MSTPSTQHPHAEGPHQGQPVRTSGAPLSRAKAAMILMHGRGSSADNMLALAEEFFQPEIAYLAPEAAGHTWYPYSFLAPLENNEPGISSGHRVMAEMLEELGGQGFPPARVAILGFSQGACLALEFTARNPRRYAGVVGLSGGLIGPPGTPRDYQGSLEGTPVFLGCSDVDPHIPVERVRESAEVMRRLGAEVTERIYPRMGHTVNADEVGFIRGLLAGLVESG